MVEPEQSMGGRVCLITGATTGIGLATARELARRNATVVLVGRSPERCRHAADSIAGETGNALPEFLVADLSSQAEVRRLADEFLARHDRLHVLINNAGALFALRQESVDGIEMTLALNHLAPFLLTNLLVDLLKASAAASAPSRIVNLSSSTQADVKAFDFDDPQADTGPRGRRYPRTELRSLAWAVTMPWAHPAVVQYAHTKLANLLFTFELARRLAGNGVTANAVHPGYVASGFSRGNGSLGVLMRFWSRLLGISEAEGARTPVYLACSLEVAEISGAYFVKEKQAQPSPAAHDAEAARRLWAMSEEMTGLGPGKQAA